MSVSDPSMATSDPQGSVPLRGDGGLDWRPVSPELALVRRVVAAVLLGVPLVGTLVLGAVTSPWVWVGSAVLAVVLAWTWWLVGRSVSAISWVELDEELVIRKGRLFRSLVSIPYGRLQYVDVTSGPLARWRGIASCEIHTASPASGGDLPGLPVDEAEALRARLAARGETQRAGL